VSEARPFDSAPGEKIYFSNAGRSMEGEDELRLVSVGVDIGSSTSHLAFSRLVLERLDNRYVVVERDVFHSSDILLTPYADAGTAIDTDALGRFIAEQYQQAGVTIDDIDTGALILTGVAVRRSNARAIGELFADQAGKFVAVSAGDGLEATLAAFGSGAVARSIRSPVRVMNIDVGGGTSKIALCAGGEILAITALDIGARIISLDETGNVARLEVAGTRFAEELGQHLEIGHPPPAGALHAIVDRMADRLFEALSATELSAETSALFRLDPLPERTRPDIVTFSGGVSEFIYGHESKSFGDLGPRLAAALRQRIETWGAIIEPPAEGIRATVIGASQYTVQVSGSTILVHPATALPLRNAAAIVPDLPLDAETLDSNAIAADIAAALRRQDLHLGSQPVALCYRWRGSATFQRLDAFCQGVTKGFLPLTDRGLPLVLVGDGDVGGLVGLHFVEETKIRLPVISIDGITMKAFDFVDIGAILDTSGAVPVVIKSLVFPTSTDLGRAAI
jgi:ethanolamine utilization protein EutA